MCYVSVPACAGLRGLTTVLQRESTPVAFDEAEVGKVMRDWRFSKESATDR
jgi:hypothetical protein